ncbi:head-tail adaptor protein [Ancylobacter lacus]|uniref:head-tail adaptor protein n=1 Tax=Ancylobacter lacus TaxID=2579970 RepID=UPI001BCF09BD|nr:head-tail adaptor protein [Ancylobacter lacus]
MSGIGAFRHRLVHETPVETADGMGGVTRRFVAIDRLWGALETTAAPAEVADRPVALAQHLVTVRAPASLEPGDQLRLGTRRLTVESVIDPDGRGRLLQCRCREEQP